MMMMWGGDDASTYVYVCIFNLFWVATGTGKM